jgi:hypothetical protein
MIAHNDASTLTQTLIENHTEDTRNSASFNSSFIPRHDIPTLTEQSFSPPQARPSRDGVRGALRLQP